MADAGAEPIRDEGLAFMGRIVAGQSHEVTNVLNIINELAGLQRDVLASADCESDARRTKLRGICDKIQLQVARGEAIIRNVNRFAHSVDTPQAVFDVKEEVCRIVFLAERWTKLKQVELVAELPDDTTALENSPFLFQCAIFACIDAALWAAADRRRISVGFSVTGGGAEVVVTSADPVPPAPEVVARLAHLRRLVDELGGELRAQPAGRAPDRFAFRVSNRRPPSAADGPAFARDNGA